MVSLTYQKQNADCSPSHSVSSASASAFLATDAARQERTVPMLIRVALFLLFFPPCMHGQAQGWEWQNPLPKGYNIHDVLMADEDWAYATCDNGYFMRSGDGGRNWETRKIEIASLVKVVSPARGIVLVLVENGSVIRSTDFGVTWSRQLNPQSRNGAFALRLIGTDEMLALLATNILVRSTDGGINWTTLQVDVVNGELLRGISIQSEAHWYVFGSRAAYETTNSGAVWSIDSSLKVGGLNALMFVDSLYGYQLRNGQLLQTYDGGNTWKEMNIFGFDNNLAIAAGPRYGNTLYCLSDGKYIVNKSTDNGTTWNISLTGTVFSDSYPSAMSFLDGEHGLVVGEGGRIVRTDNGGLSWSIIHGLGYIGPLTDMIFTSRQNGIALSFSPTMLITTNGGARWDEGVPHPDYSPRRISMYNTSGGFVYAYDVSNKAHVLATMNLGRNWAYKSALPISKQDAQFIQPQAILAISADTLFISASDGLLFRSTDGALTWDSLSTCSMFGNDWESGNALFWFAPGTLVYVGSQGVGRSTDAGNTWECFFSNGLRQVQFFSPDSAIGIAQGRLATTVNGGTTWHVTSRPGFDFMHFFSLREGIGLRNGITATLSTTSDGGNTWSDNDLHESVDDWYGWFFISKEEGWSYGYGGMIRHTGNGGITGIPTVPTNAAGFQLGHGYPNPLSISRHRAANISFRIPEGVPRLVSIDVYSVLGTKITTLFEGTVSAGEHAVTLDSRAIPGGLRPGLYVYQLVSGETRINRSMIVAE